MNEPSNKAPHLSHGKGIAAPLLRLINVVYSWVFSSLTRQFIAGMAATLLVALAVMFTFIVGVYILQLRYERSVASVQVNKLLQSSLENAMLKRDLDGLRYIVQRLGAQEDIRGVMIINPDNVVRFASDPEMLGTRFSRDESPSCLGCHNEGKAASDRAMFMSNEKGEKVLRSVNPVHNKPQCFQCHGPVDENPINGVLFVDFDAAPIEQNARSLIAKLTVSGALVLLVMGAGGWFFMRRSVLAPIDRLAEASRSLADGNLGAQVKITNEDELGQLGRVFNTMANHLLASMREIKEKEDFLQALIETSPDAIRVIDEDYTIIMANKTYRKQLGLSPGQCVGEKCHVSSHQLDSPCAPTMVLCPLHEFQNKAEGPVRAVHRHLRQDGSEMYVEIYAAPLRLEREGKVQTLVVESIRDLSKAVHYSHEQKLSSIGLLAAGMAHEIHNPLAAIRVAMQSSLRTLMNDVTDKTKLQHYLELVDKKIDQCIEATERLLKLSVFPSEKPMLVMVNPALEETAELLSYEATGLNITIEYDFSPEQLRIISVDSEIRMMALNFMQNSFHFMPDGGTLTIRTALIGDEVKIVFEDTGAGINYEDLQYIFDPFFSRRKDQTEGTGLGLSIIKAIIDRYHGSVDVSSVPGEGTKFTVTFPNADRVAPQTKV